ncbi:MAG: fibronectin type III domain-containing protein [Gemmatimonadales bacterium]|nr:fibronectin type III domain-containing protein [Gemmatimonadales bacterium]MBP9199232.1 fibronectin type III domain-containing protein [Gemmatimonadales bacterium]
MRILATPLAALAALGACGGGSDGPTGGNTPPSAVAGVAATIANNTVSLSWNPVPGAVGYRVYMASTSGVTRTNVTTLPGNMTHTDLPTQFEHPPGLDANTTYFFIVTAVNSAGESSESCEVSAEIGTASSGSC